VKKLHEPLTGLLIGSCILACGLVGNGLYASFRECQVVGVRFAFLGFLLLATCILYKLRSRRSGARPTLWWGVFLTAVLAGASADSWQGWLESPVGSRTARVDFLGLILYSFLFFPVLLWVRSSFQKIPPRSLIDIKTEDPEGRSHLILFLSEISDLRTFPNGIPAWLTGDDRNLDRDLEKLAEEKSKATPTGQVPRFWAWEQPLRAIKHHHHLDKKTLRTVTVIASEKSVRQSPLFARLIAAYPELKHIQFKLLLRTTDDQTPRLIQLDQHTETSGGWSFEDFTKLAKGVHGLLRLLNQNNIEDSDIMIDFTGGKKVTSVVAAAMTFNRSVKAQYVETEEPWKVLSYEVVTAAELGPGT